MLVRQWTTLSEKPAQYKLTDFSQLWQEPVDVRVLWNVLHNSCPIPIPDVPGLELRVHIGDYKVLLFTSGTADVNYPFLSNWIFNSKFVQCPVTQQLRKCLEGHKLFTFSIHQNREVLQNKLAFFCNLDLHPANKHEAIVLEKAEQHSPDTKLPATLFKRQHETIMSLLNRSNTEVTTNVCGALDLALHFLCWANQRPNQYISKLLRLTKEGHKAYCCMLACLCQSIDINYITCGVCYDYKRYRLKEQRAKSVSTNFRVDTDRICPTGVLPKHLDWIACPMIYLATHKDSTLYHEWVHMCPMVPTFVQGIKKKLKPMHKIQMASKDPADTVIMIPDKPGFGYIQRYSVKEQKRLFLDEFDSSIQKIVKYIHKHKKDVEKIIEI